MEEHIWFRSHELLNRIYETDLWTWRANLTEGFTADCRTVCARVMAKSGLPVLMKYLVEHAEVTQVAQTVFEHLNRTERPSYGYFLNRGETTWPEYWWRPHVRRRQGRISLRHDPQPLGKGWRKSAPSPSCVAIAELPVFPSIPDNPLPDHALDGADQGINRRCAAGASFSIRG